MNNKQKLDYECVKANRFDDEHWLLACIIELATEHKITPEESCSVLDNLTVED